MLPESNGHLLLASWRQDLLARRGLPPWRVRHARCAMEPLPRRVLLAAPVNTVPPPQIMVEDTAIVFSVAGGNGISIADSDAGGENVTVALSVSSGNLTLSQPTALSFSIGDGVSDAAMTFEGTLASINVALDGMSFTPAADFTGTANFIIETEDEGTSGPGGAAPDSDSFNITVTSGANDPAVLNLPPQQFATEDVGLIFSSSKGNAISLTDPDAGSTPFTITLSSPGKLSLAQTTGLTFISGDGSDDAAMSFTGTINAINAALDGLTFLAADNPLLTGTLSISATDGTQNVAGSVSISITGVNDAPVNTVPTAPQSVNEDGSLVFSTANGNRIAVLDYDVGIGVLRVTLTVTGGTVTLANLIGLTMLIDDGTANALVSFQGLPSWINAALDGLIFHPTPDYAGPASIRIQTSDLGSTGTGGTQGDNDTIAIDVAAINDAPVLSVPPGTLLVDEGEPLIFGLASGNAVLVVDIDAGSGALRVKLEADHGTITLATLGGLTFVNGDGTDDALVIATGSLADVNAALNGLTFTPAAGYSGPASLQLSVKDQGNTGQGGNLSAETNLALLVAPINDAPILILSPAPLEYVAGDEPLPVDSALELSDPDAGDSIRSATIRIVGYVEGEDVLRFASKYGITGRFDAETGILSLNGVATPAGYQAALRSVTYINLSAEPTQSSRAITIEVSDALATGSARRVLMVNSPVAPPPPPPPLPPTPPEPQDPIDLDPIDPVDPDEPEPIPNDPDAPSEPRSPVDNTPSTPGGGDQSTGGSTGDGTSGGGMTIVEEAIAPPATPQGEPAAPVQEQENQAEQLPARGAPVIESSVATPAETMAPAPIVPADSATAAPEVAFVAADGQFWNDLDTLREEMQRPEKTLRLLAGVASAGTIGLSVVYILWTIRAGYLLASLLSSMPAWRFIDPLPILDQFDSAARRRRDAKNDDSEGDDDESLQTLVDAGNLKGATR
jgi:VCBS repeat-containing protein